MKFFEDEFADFADVFGEALAGLPVGLGEDGEVEGERAVPAEEGEVEVFFGEDAELDGLGVGAEFGVAEAAA